MNHALSPQCANTRFGNTQTSKTINNIHVTTRAISGIFQEGI